MKRWNTWLIIVLIVMVSFAFGVQQSRPIASAATTGQKWEYAQLYASYTDGRGQFIALVSDPDEKQQLDTDLSQFGATVGGINVDPSGTATAIPIPDIFASAKALDYMGSLGWELVSYTEQLINGQTLTIYTFKRPV